MRFYNQSKSVVEAYVKDLLLRHPEIVGWAISVPTRSVSVGGLFARSALELNVYFKTQKEYEAFHHDKKEQLIYSKIAYPGAKKPSLRVINRGDTVYGRM